MANDDSGMTPYQLLKSQGHSPAKAAEIVLDAKRGNPYALRWIEICRVPIENSPKLASLNL